MKHLDLFAGLGGFSLASDWLGIETVGFCEIDPWCRRVLLKHWPNVPQHDDIRTLTGDALRRFGPVDLITGGFPCQPVSLAGQRRGVADDRALWPDMRRVIDECRPTYVMAENTYGLVSMGLDQTLADLETDGYACRTVCIPALALDAQHRRERVWVISHATGVFRKEIERVEQNGILPRLESTRPIVDERRWWPTEPRMDRVAHGVSKRVERLTGLGNAIVPQVAYEILRVMIGETA